MGSTKVDWEVPVDVAIKALWEVPELSGKYQCVLPGGVERFQFGEERRDWESATKVRETEGGESFVVVQLDCSSLCCKGSMRN